MWIFLLIKTISALNENTDTASDKNESVRKRSATDSAFTNDNGNPATGNTSNHSSYSVSPETIDRITSEILDKNHKLWKQTTIGLGSACLGTHGCPARGRSDFFQQIKHAFFSDYTIASSCLCKQ